MAGNRAVLFAHPSADMYGSDRVLLESLTAMVARGWRVDVALPDQGPLVPEIEARGDVSCSVRRPYSAGALCDPLASSDC